MTETAANNRLEDLAVVIDRLGGLHHELLELTGEKIERMREADLPALMECVSREEKLVEQIRSQEGLRCQLMDRIGRSYGINPQIARRMCASQLLERIEPQQRRQLAGPIERLKKVVEQLSAANQAAMNVAQQVLEHIRAIFEAVSTSDQSAEVYSGLGRIVSARGKYIFDAMG